MNAVALGAGALESLYDVYHTYKVGQRALGKYGEEPRKFGHYNYEPKMMGKNGGRR
jgi:hypothetical protein